MAKKGSKINEYNEALENAKPRDYNFSGYGEVLEEGMLQSANPNPLVYGYEIDEETPVPDYFVNVSTIQNKRQASPANETTKPKAKVVSKKVINKRVSQENSAEKNHTKTVTAYKSHKPKSATQVQDIPDDLLKYAYDFEKMIQHLLKQAGKKRRMVNKMVADLSKSSRR